MRAIAVMLLIACNGTNNSFRGTDEYTAKLVNEIVIDARDLDDCGWIVFDRANGVAVETNTEFLDEIGKMGWKDDIGGRITIQDPTPTNSTSNYIVLVHEIGHAMGLEHQGAGIMAENYWNVTKEDALLSLLETAKRLGVLKCNQSVE